MWTKVWEAQLGPALMGGQIRRKVSDLRAAGLVVAEIRDA